MSTPVNPARQQLEDLDALLQRMLSLPLNQLEAEAPPAPPPTYAPTPRPVPPPPRRRAEPPASAHAWNVPLPPGGNAAAFNAWPAGIEALTSNATSTVTPRQLPEPAPPARLRVTTIPAPEPAPAAPVQRLRVETPATIPIPPPAPTLLAMPAEAPLPFYLWPMGVLDRSFGGAFAAFGAPGRWLGMGSGKVFFGWCGLLMIVAAAAVGVMDYLGLSW